MLAGRYPSDEFAELRPRIVWDRLAHTLRARDGAQRLAVTSGGTIPDRGLYGVFLADSGARVGELDEEMVYEARQGEVFQLGATSWRIEQITRDRVLVSAAPGVPGKMPFWKGDGVGRPYELGRAVGEAVRTRRFGELDRRSAFNLTAYLDDQRSSTGVVPDDRTIVVERFRDEIGDWRICLLSPFGGRVHAPWALAIESRLGAAMGIEVEAMWSDDGIALRLPDADAPPPLDLMLIAPDELDDLLLSQIASSPLFAGRFRENAARALLIPRRRPGQRTPLWQQRLKAHDLQQVAMKYSSFPIVLETYRELLSDVFEVPALRELLAAVGRGRGSRGRGRVGASITIRQLAAVRLHRHLHVRGRRPGRGAPRPGTEPRPGAAGGVALGRGSAGAAGCRRNRAGAKRSAGRPAAHGR